MFLIYDTETTGLPKDYNAPLSDFDNWPRLVQLAWQVHNSIGELVELKNFIIKPEGFEIPYGAEKIHGISTERAKREGQALEFVLAEFNKSIEKAHTIAGHNIEFDNSITGCEFLRKKTETSLFKKNIVDTKDLSTEFCALPGGRGGKYKWPKLSELHQKLFGQGFEEAHNAAADVQATARCFLELIRIGIIGAAELKLDGPVIDNFRAVNKASFEAVELDIESFREEKADHSPGLGDVEHDLDEKVFTHLHVHTEFSVLDGLSNIPKMIAKAKADGMTACAITDHGAMFGVKSFHQVCMAEKIKPIIGCEFYIARRSMEQKENKTDGGGWHLVLLAKNETGYKNLMFLVSKGWTEGYYYKPRIDKDLLRRHSDGLIALTACLSGELPSKIVNEGETQAEQSLLGYKEIFGDDLYLELQRHPTGDPEMDKNVFDDQVFVSKVLRKLSEKHSVKLVATNDSHFVDAEDADAHDRLICIGTAKDIDDPRRMHYTRQEWFKTQDEMKRLFADIPEAIENIAGIVDKIEVFELDHKPIMPIFEIPDEFADADEYLRHCAYEGAGKRYPDLTDSIRERIDFELETIKKMGFPDYFLIVWDFLRAAREMGVVVGPGRGSAAGSVVAYSLRITEIDPLAYNLLFERFLNPDRISMPDIDIDFDDDGRELILKWVKEKYGKNRVAHLITFGTMAAKMAIRDVARVQKLPLNEADRLAKMIPDTPGTSLRKAFKEVPELQAELDKGKPEIRDVLKNALTLEGSVRNIGTHACGIIISKEDLTNYVPVSVVKDSVLDLCTQYDGKYIESIGLLKMDFLGLKTLSIIKETIENIKQSKGISIDIDNVDLNDKETYELYSRGDTSALFQFESDGMQKYLKDLKPTRFEDLIAMNALYRPGPMQYIPDFVERKHGRQEIKYDLPVMEEILKETYGITVYQEQVMLLSRKMAGFTRGQSDSLRKAMGKKKIKDMEKLKAEFVEGCEANGLATEKVLKVWKDWEEFAKYAFNKSHATCYSYVSYQTAYLKTHYPAEFIAANLSRNLNDIKKITQYTAEAEHMGISVTRPDINESLLKFSVTGDKIIRFGMGAIKGVGGAAVENIINERKKNGPFKSPFDFVKRVSLRSVNKRSIEALVMAGAFDGFENTHRAQYFHKENENAASFVEILIKHGHSFQEQQNSMQQSLFGGTDEIAVKDPEMPVCAEWLKPQLLKSEKEVTGFYISGHPLDDFKTTIQRYCNVEVGYLRSNLKKFKGHTVSFAGMITKSQQRMSKKGSPFGIITLEDFSGQTDLMQFSEDYLKRKHFLEVGNNIFVQAKIEERWRGGDLDIKVSNIMLLSDAMNKLTSCVFLTIKLEYMDNKLIEDLVRLVKENPGNSKLKIKLVAPGNKNNISMKSSAYKVEPQTFVNEISKLGNISFKLES
ncbi:MAG: DNA polymerase III subunit alpha [Chlorobi bacterium]|nr:DNA polymerase III subunit alpha [Chlorobiota bacterium]